MATLTASTHTDRIRPLQQRRGDGHVRPANVGDAERWASLLGGGTLALYGVSRGAKNALEAGFDGVEIHAANGYLLDQFVNSSTNRRADGYGGPVENRARLLGELVEAVSAVWEPDRVGVRLSPLGAANDISDDDPETTFGYVAGKLGDHRLAYLHIVNPALAAIEQGTEPDPRACEWSS